MTVPLLECGSGTLGKAADLPVYQLSVCWVASGSSLQNCDSRPKREVAESKGYAAHTADFEMAACCVCRVACEFVTKHCVARAFASSA